jgi:RHS repeat-associated protein
LLSGVTYDSFGPAKGWTWGNSTTSSRTFDTDGKVSQIVSAATKNYGYDDAFRITGITDTGTSANSYTYGYDSLDRLTSAVKTGTTRGWTYDASGNRLSETGASPSTYTISSTNNRISSISGSLARTYTYSTVGSALTYSNITATYNNHGRLKTLKKATTTATYVYNALDQLVKQSGGPSGTVHYVYDEAGHLLGEYNSTGALIEETIWLGDTPVATLRPGTPIGIFYVHTDHLNTPRRVTQPSGNQLRWTWEADPFGTATPNENPASLGTFKYNLRFPGQIYDSHGGLMQNYFRDYDPAIGRYVESDPLGLIPGVGSSQTVPGFVRGYFSKIPLAKRVAKGTNQPYAYVSDDPIALIDPLGLYGTSDCSYYVQRCAQVGGVYYCYIAPAVCSASPNTGWSGCVRECLQSADKRVCNTCKGGSDVWCTIGAHEYCWVQCTKNTSDAPPL